jgi:hypothetical protein
MQRKEIISIETWAFIVALDKLNVTSVELQDIIDLLGRMFPDILKEESKNLLDEEDHKEFNINH